MTKVRVKAEWSCLWSEFFYNVQIQTKGMFGKSWKTIKQCANEDKANRIAAQLKNI